MNRQLFNAMVAQYGNKTVTSANDVLEWSGGAHCYLPSLKFHGACRQNGTPTPENPVDIYDHIGVYKANGKDDVIYLPNLRGIGDYKDEWDYVTGKGLRYVDKIVLDGKSARKKAEGVSFLSSKGLYYAMLRVEHKSFHARYNLLMSTHFKGEWTFLPGTVYMSGSGDYLYRQILIYHTDQTLDTVDKWNAWLAEQYANGTPVTIYYALAEPIPFEERPQPYTPIPNDNGRIAFIDGPVYDKLPPFELTYITHS